MSIQTTRFGVVSIDDSQIITMPSGLLGFSNERHFTLLEDHEDSPFRWLQSLDSPDLAFVTIEPHVAISDYSLSLSREHLRKVDAPDLEALTVMVIVTMTRELSNVTVNLQGPLILNLKKHLGMQLVLTDSKYSIRHPLFGDKLEMPPVEQSKSSKSQKKKSVAKTG